MGKYHITYEPTTEDHLRILSETLRAADRDEVMSFGVSPYEALRLSFDNSFTAPFSTFVDGELACIYGCGGSMLEPVGRPWLLTSPAIEKIPVTLVRQYRLEVRRMLNIFMSLENYVAADYTGAIRLLRLAGFTVGEPEPYGKGVFRKFVLHKDDREWA